MNKRDLQNGLNDMGKLESLDISKPYFIWQNNAESKDLTEWNI